MTSKTDHDQDERDNAHIWDSCKEHHAAKAHCIARKKKWTAAQEREEMLEAIRELRECTNTIIWASTIPSITTISIKNMTVKTLKETEKWL